MSTERIEHLEKELRELRDVVLRLMKERDDLKLLLSQWKKMEVALRIEGKVSMYIIPVQMPMASFRVVEGEK